MFDGGIGFSRRNFSFNTKSRRLIDDFNEILRRLGIKYSFNDKQNIANGLYQTFVWPKDELCKVLEHLIEPGTTKWRQLDVLLNGLDASEENTKLLEELYPVQRKSAVGFIDVIKLFEKDKPLSKKDVGERINRSERTVRSLLNSLERMKVLKSETNNFYKVWKLNSVN